MSGATKKFENSTLTISFPTSSLGERSGKKNYENLDIYVQIIGRKGISEPYFFPKKKFGKNILRYVRSGKKTVTLIFCKYIGNRRSDLYEI